MISIVLGTRPEIIKMAPIIRACMNKGIGFSIIHTGQHYSYSMDRIFFEELELPVPQYHLEVGSGNHGEQTGKIMAGVERVYLDDRPDIVLVQGDTNTVMAAALASSKLNIPVGHVEAGLRSFDGNGRNGSSSVSVGKMYDPVQYSVWLLQRISFGLPFTLLLRGTLLPSNM